MDLFSSVLALLLLCAPPPVLGSALPEGPIDAALGRNVTIPTKLPVSTYTVIIWTYSDGSDSNNIVTVAGGVTTVAPAYGGRVAVNASNGFLSLNGLTSKDSGDYSISAVGGEQTYAGEIKLRVLEPVTGVGVSGNLQEAIEFNSTVILTCQAQGSFLTFTWLKGDAPILPDDKKRIIIEEAESTSTLSFSRVLRSDLIGPIFCRVANKLGPVKSPAFTLPIHYGPEEVRIHPAKPAQFIRARSPFNLTCTAVSSPAAAFSWFHDDEEQPAGQGAVLTLDAIEKLGYGERQGMFTCRAANAKTLRSASSPPVTFGVVEPISGLKVMGPPDSVLLLAGNSSANLSCAASSGSVSLRAWLKDGKPLAAASAAPRVQFSPDSSSLAIAPVTKDDNAKFTCRVSSAVNTAETSYTMVVHYGPETPVIQGRDAVEVDDPVTLTCSAPSRPPANYTWRFNGTLQPVTTATFSIPKALYSSSGVYVCEASNAVTGGKSRASHTLSVKEELVEGLSDGAIAGIVVGVLVALVAAVALVFYCRQKVPVDSPY